VNRRLHYLEGFRDALDTVVFWLKRCGVCNEVVKALEVALASVEEEIRALKALYVHPVSTLAEELEKLRVAKHRVE